MKNKLLLVAILCSLILMLMADICFAEEKTGKASTKTGGKTEQAIKYCNPELPCEGDEGTERECRVDYPSYCVNIENDEYSTGGGDSIFEIMEVGCRTKDNIYVKYLVSNVLPGGFFGAGRLNFPVRILYVPDPNLRNRIKLSCKYVARK